MQTPVEVRYAGVVVGRTDRVQAHENARGRLFVGLAEPLPVGTTVELVSGTEVLSARVTRVVESVDPAVAGMDVALPGAAAEAPAVVTPEPASARAPAEEPPAAAPAAEPAKAPPDAVPPAASLEDAILSARAPEADTRGVPEAVGGEGSGGGSGDASQAIEVSTAIEASTAIETGGSDRSGASGGGKRKRSKRKR